MMYSLTLFQVIVGVCAMEKKTLSKPMKEILTRLEEFEYIKTCIFTEKVILEVSNLSSVSQYKYLISPGPCREVASL